MTDQALRSRRPVATLATIALAAAAVYANVGNASLVRSIDVQYDDWATEPTSSERRVPITGDACISCKSDTCAGRVDAAACYRDRFRAQLEAYESNKSYDEVRQLSPTGAAFTQPTTVRSVHYDAGGQLRQLRQRQRGSAAAPASGGAAESTSVRSGRLR